MHETILNLAKTISECTDGEAALLETLCTAAEKKWTGRLCEGISTADCEESFVCAAAYTAAAQLLASRGGKSAVSSFTAGSVSVARCSAQETGAASGALQNQAEALMAPYVVEDRFSFRGVDA